MLKNISFFLKILSFFILVFIWVYTMITYGKLPETVPIHFGLDGKADGFGSKNTNWFLAGISSVIFILMMYLSKNPNAPGLNIPENLKKDPAISEFVVSIFCVLIIFLFANINYESIQVSLGKVEGLSHITNYILGLMLLFIIAMMIYSWRLTKKSKI
ncbi:DUF1648 domain-containing protein [Chryseobacterium suipulveris]|uniref:DUF1648 domain-containing protein n=1 Tax=Chryseobacterium suipulveris TaxID=2929800 RepID=A0ABY4BQF7_9FLAO|nr:DUF1648 domain-containing protein [Chryseobacterium suipulveris]UOE41412.1 DUF1648 domain-containing protein [Chryseobacterium suipulveris]